VRVATRLAAVTGCAWLLGWSHVQAPTLKLGERVVPFEFTHWNDTAVPVVISMHANETTAREVTRELLATQPGRFVGIQASGEPRRLALRPGEDRASIDPNRMFSMEGIALDLPRGGPAREGDAALIDAFAKSYLATFIGSAKLVVAVHNNTEGAYSILSYRPGGSEAAATGELNVVENQDPDDFFLVTDRRHYDALRQKGYNVVLQSNDAPDDGSLSVYAARHGITYVNVEAQQGANARQAAMMKDLWAILLGAPR
jgi:hypothetical protein